MKPVANLLLLMIALTAIMLLPQGAVAQDSGEPDPPGVGVFEVDSFTYRAAFKLTDGTEALLIRGRFIVYWFDRHHQPTVNEHHMSVTIGFYYGRTILGRSLVQEVRTEGIGFYPWWHDSAGWMHDTFPGTPLYSVNGTVPDMEMMDTMLLMDPDSQSMFIPDFGGTLVIDGLTLVMNDGSEYVAIDETLEIRLEKHYNNLEPYAATVSGSENVSYVSSTDLLTINVAGSAPLILWIDFSVGVSLIGTGATLLVLTGLHLLGRISLPMGRLRRTALHKLQTGTDRKSG